MNSLANHLVSKSKGHIHTMPAPIAKPAKVKGDRNSFKLTGIYLDEDGGVTSINKIAKKYDVSQCKVRRLFLVHDYQEAYKLIGLDARANNGRKEVYALPCGKFVPARLVADHYNVSLSLVQRTWVKNGKCSIKANKYLENKYPLAIA